MQIVRDCCKEADMRLGPPSARGDQVDLRKPADRRARPQ